MHVLKCFSSLEMSLNVQSTLFFKSLAFISICVQECCYCAENFSHELVSGMVAILLFNELRDFVLLYIPDRENFIIYTFSRLSKILKDPPIVSCKSNRSLKIYSFKQSRFWIKNEASHASFPRWRTTIAVCHTATTTSARKVVKS